jgi:hypothetical protein
LDQTVGISARVKYFYLCFFFLRKEYKKEIDERKEEDEASRQGSIK